MHDKWQARSNVTVDLGLRWEYYTPLVGLEGKGSLANYDPATHTIRVAGYGDTRQRAEREEELQELLAAHRRVVAPQRADGRARRLRREHDSVPGQPLRVQLPGEAELRRRRRRTGSSAPARWRPASRRRRCSTFRRTASSRSRERRCRTPRSTSSRPDLHEGTLHSWNVAFQRQLPYLLTADIAYVGNRGVDLVMDVDTNASMVYGSGNNGPAAVRAVQPHGRRTATRTNDNKSTYHGLQMKVDRRFRNGLLLTNSYTLSRAMDYVERERRHRHADRLRAELGTRRTSIACTTTSLTGDLRAAVGPGQAVAERRAARQDHRRLAVERHLHRAVGHAADHRRQRHAAQHARQHRVRQPERRAQGARRPRARQLLYFDPTVYSLPAAGAQGNMTRNSGPEGPGFWQLDGSLFKRFAHRRRPLRRVPRRRVQRDQLGALGQPEHRLQHRRPATRSARSPARPAASAASGSAGRFVF